MTSKNRIELWRDKGLTLTDRLELQTAQQRTESEVFNRKVERGDISQELRLKYYPSIAVDRVEFSKMYAGSIDGDLEKAEDLLFEMGFRNNPTAYVEVTDQFGPDDGSYARQFITEDSEFPYLGVSRPLGVVAWWNRIKLQYHVAVFVDTQRDMVHILCHREPSAWLQPARHISISEGNAEIGVRDFRDFWKDEFGEGIERPLEELL